MKTTWDCPLCGSVKTVARCGSCGLEFHEADDGILVSTAGSEPLGYPEDGNELSMQVEETSFWFQHRNRAIFALVRNHSVDGALWDIGGGNGFQALRLQEDLPVVDGGARSGRMRLPQEAGREDRHPLDARGTLAAGGLRGRAELLQRAGASRGAARNVR